MIRPRSHKIFFVLALVASLLALGMPAAHAWERSTPNVAPDSLFYMDLDKLVALGLAHPPILGQRPWPRSEFARITAEAMAKHQAEVEAMVEGESEGLTLREFERRLERRRFVEGTLARLKEEFEEELVDMGALEGDYRRYRVHPLREFVIEAEYLSEAPVTIPPNNGRGSINAVVNPLRDYDLGRHSVFGALTSVEFDASVDAGKYFSAYVRPRFEALIPRREDMNGKALLQNGYGVFRAGNFALQFGRDSMLWGFGERGSLLFSSNPRPLDGVRVTNPTPARLPWIFKYLGEWRYTLYGYTLGPEYQPKWAWLTGYKLNLAPSRWVELGFGHVMEIGGEGVYSPSALDVIGGFFGFRPRGTDPGSPQTDNHIFEIEALVRIPPARGMQIYGNIAIDDKWKSVKKTLKDGCSYMGGVYFPALTSSGATDLRLEVVRTSALYGHHDLFRDGYTINQKLIGSDAGPDAWTAYALLRHRLSPKLWYGLSFGWDYRRSDTYAESTNPDGLAGPIVKIATGPTDVRYRGLLDVDYTTRKRVGLHLTAGYERAQNQGFVEGNDVNNFLVAASLTFNFDRHFAFAAH